jgi:hypothetical protein
MMFDSLVEVYRYFKGTCCKQGACLLVACLTLQIEAECSLETFVNFYRTIQRHIPEDRNLLKGPVSYELFYWLLANE